MSVFGNYAKYYDLLYADKAYDKEVEYIHTLIQNHAPKTRTLLELGCGTGIHAIALAEHGYSVDGIDISQEMLTEANARLSELPPKQAGQLSFTQGDVRTYKSKKTYDSVISLFHIVSYQITNDDLKQMFQTAARHCNPDGVFIFDVWYGPAVLTQRPELRAKELENEAIKVVRVARPVHYPTENRVDVNYEIIIFDKKTTAMEELFETHPMRYLFTPELKLLLTDAGFELLTSEEWLTGNDPGFDTWGVTFVTRKVK